MKALAKDPRDRFATMEELRQAFLADNLPMPTYRAPGRTQNYRSQPASTLPMPAAHASTTLSASPREVVADSPAGDKKKSRAGLVLGAVLLAGGVATYLFMVPRAAKNAEPAPASATEPAAATAAPVASKMVTVRFESDPAGAHVARVTDEKDLGAVPFELKLPRAGGKPEYRFHLDGYQDQTLTADLASDLTLKATLEKTPAAPPPAQAATPPPPPGPAAHVETPHRPAATPHHTPHAARPSGDDDGLATPKF
jgi:hypothetical protein